MARTPTTPRPTINPLTYNLAYDVLKYQVGLDWDLGNSPIFIDLGWMGDNWSNKQNAPINRTYNGPFAGTRIPHPVPVKAPTQGNRSARSLTGRFSFSVLSYLTQPPLPAVRYLLGAARRRPTVLFQRRDFGCQEANEVAA